MLLVCQNSTGRPWLNTYEGAGQRAVTPFSCVAHVIVDTGQRRSGYCCYCATTQWWAECVRAGRALHEAWQWGY